MDMKPFDEAVTIYMMVRFNYVRTVTKYISIFRTLMVL